MRPLVAFGITFAVTMLAVLYALKGWGAVVGTLVGCAVGIAIMVPLQLWFLRRRE